MSHYFYAVAGLACWVGVWRAFSRARRQEEQRGLFAFVGVVLLYLAINYTWASLSLYGLLPVSRLLLYDGIAASVGAFLLAVVVAVLASGGHNES